MRFKRTQAVTKNQNNRPTWARVSSLRWIVLAVFAIILSLSFASYHPQDPAWSQTTQFSMPHNWLGSLGAYLSDLFLYSFGFSAWWLPVCLGVRAWTHYRWLAGKKRNQRNLKRRFGAMIGGFFLLLMSSSAFEAIRLYSMEWSLPLGAGGLLGAGLGRIIMEALGFLPATLLFLAGMLFGFQWWSGEQWLDRCEQLGEWLETRFFSLQRMMIAREQVAQHEEKIEILRPKQERFHSDNDHSPERIEPLLKAPKQDFPIDEEELFFAPRRASVPEVSQERAEPVTSESPQPLEQANIEPEIHITAPQPMPTYAVDTSDHAANTTPVPIVQEALPKDSVTVHATEHIHATVPTPAHVDPHLPMPTQQNDPFVNPASLNPSLAPVLNPSFNPIERGLEAFEFVVPDDHEPNMNISSERVAPSQAGSLDQLDQLNQGELSFNPEPTRLKEDDLAPVPALLDAPLELDLPDNLSSLNAFDHAPPHRMELPDEHDTNGQFTLDFSMDEETQVLQGFVPLPKKKRQIVQADTPTFEFEGFHPIPSQEMTAGTPQTQTVSALSENPFKTEVILPPFSLLDPQTPPVAPRSEKQMQEFSALIEQTLEEFDIKVHVKNAILGPVITQFELEPAKGVKGAQIVALTRDLARALQVRSVRVLENILGKRCLGLEVANDVQPMISLSDVMHYRAYRDSKSLLALAVGKTADGQAAILDLQTLPHLLIAGAGGTGKSLTLSAMILSILYRASPDQVRLILIDPNMLELSIFTGIPHLLTPVITDMTQAVNSLAWCVGEMERRYQLMAALSVRQIGAFNEKVRNAWLAGAPIESPFAEEILHPLPQIVIVVDELADVLAADKRAAEKSLVTLAQKARVAGIHLILATQRANVDVLSSSLKAQIPARLSFHLSSKVESRAILDQIGAEYLLNVGDALYLAPNKMHLERLHCAYVSEAELERTVNFLRKTGKPRYVDAVICAQDTPPEAEAPPEDPRYLEAVNLARKKQHISVPMIQKYLRISYGRATRLVQEMEQRGIISAPDAQNQRYVLQTEHEHNP